MSLFASNLWRRIIPAASVALAMQACAGHWQRIPVRDLRFIDQETGKFHDDDGIIRRPMCSGGPVITREGFKAAETEFSFFFREGDRERLLIHLDGGGACWNPETCIGSAMNGAPLYAPRVGETARTLDRAGGIFDRSNPANPFRDFTQVFIPYCTGDVHWGSRDVVYRFEPLSGDAIEWTVHHRGFDNVATVMKWVGDRYPRAETAVLTGSSAGGYGVLLALPALKSRLPNAETYLLADAANGIVTDAFFDEALGGRAVTGGSWAIGRNIPDFLAPAFQSGPGRLPVAVYTALASRFPSTRLGQYTRARDATQVFYYNVMQHSGAPARWHAPGALHSSTSEWHRKARAAMELTTRAFNYRFYFAAGTGHGVLLDDFLYEENSAGGVRIIRWIEQMLEAGSPGATDEQWRNVSCDPDCLDGR